MSKRWLALSAAAAAALLAVPAAMGGADPGNGKGEQRGASKGKAHNFHSKAGKKQAYLRDQALKAKAEGKAKGKVYEVAKGQFVDLEQTGDDPVFVILAEFGDEVSSVTGGTPGPRHNEIEQPDRAVDNTTIWQADYDKAHYEDMYFNRMDAYYKAQSSGRYGVHGEVQDWVQAPNNAAFYGSNSRSDAYAWLLIRDALAVWVEREQAAGKTTAQIAEYLKQFDVYDRYDHDGDGEFDEADGYIDHFQIVHAGAGEETGGGAQGTDAIWSHRWYAFESFGSSGPEGNLHGGIQIGDTGIWMGDYTIQPENGGLGVFAHEFGHDLGLPDHYDTTYLGENSSAFWTLMSAGSYLNDGGNEIGNIPGDMSAWDKFALGWLNYEVASAGTRSTHRLGPAETTTKQAQGLFVVLPQKEHFKTFPAAPEGEASYWSGSGALMDNAMTRTASVPADATSVTMKLWYEIEQDWDYAYVSVSTNGGETWTNLAGTGTTTTDPNGQNEGNGITGTTDGNWVDASYDISPFAGQTVTLAVRYWTDPYVNGAGLLADDIRLGAEQWGAESEDDGWTLDGFSRVAGEVSLGFHPNYYLAEFRQYRGYDAGLRTGPYNWSHASTKPDYAERFPYQDGLLISYWDTFWGEDNNVGAHPGEGFLLPIDARPEPLLDPNGVPWRTRLQVFDATFGLEPTDPITLHQDGVPVHIPSSPAVPVFDDTQQYWFASKPDAGVKVPGTGTRIEVTGTSAQGSFMQVHVGPSK